MEEGEIVGGCREQDRVYGDEIEASKETKLGECTNTMDIDINSELGPDRADRSVDYKSQADSVTEVPKSSSEKMKAVPDKCHKNSIGLVGFDIAFLTAEFPSQSDIENYVTRVHIYFPL